MEEIVEILERIADALEARNRIDAAWIEKNEQWHKESVERDKLSYLFNVEWTEWIKQRAGE